ncbi:hypothetical protein CFP65_0857 [Kitasatospora sp. MMS16-BH015]|uniref:hypothetical protein n=1 Tax=Kitasatospora sp. MMS16-BH015 TaxID=2018025 RepID=UPI000CA2FE43|nr:hypothetical protein [Kitasatospora sp. MMS16-BH015]AUG75784.1 hypothetical protein CFP65_0857 [Kitasatospora sp. MMS16-BH015]
MHGETGGLDGSNDRRPAGEWLVRNEFSGVAREVVQAGSIGELHVHSSPPRLPPAASPLALTSVVVATEYVTPGGWDEAVPCSGGAVRIHAEACEDRAVLLRALRIVVVARRPPVEGVELPTAGVPEVRRYTVDLDRDPPRLAGPEFLYTVTPDDPEVFELSVRCERFEVEWRAEVDWICGGRTGTSVADLAGEPFRFTAAPSSSSKIGGVVPWTGPSLKCPASASSGWSTRRAR